MDLPFLTHALPGIGGRIKAQIEDFEVEEIPAYEPCGQGEHLYLWIEKRDVGAEFLIQELSRRLSVRSGDIGTAGLKDRRAVTRQWVSVPAAAESRLDQIEGGNIRVLRIGRHTNKLRPGHLRGNRFRILIRDAAGDPTPILGRVAELGLPNFYGPQRFGRDGQTGALGMALLRHERTAKPNRFLLKLALSAAQSCLFNDYLARRLTDGLLRTVLPGEVMAKWPVGGMFVAHDVPAEQRRLDARETIPAGPMFGTKLFPAADRAAEREAEVLAAAGLTEASFAGFGDLLTGTRRHNVVYVDELAAAPEPEGTRLKFTLPAGSYATVLLREVMKNDCDEAN